MPVKVPKYRIEAEYKYLRLKIAYLSSQIKTKYQYHTIVIKKKNQLYRPCKEFFRLN